MWEDGQIGVSRNSIGGLRGWVSLRLFLLVFFAFPAGVAVAQQTTPEATTPSSSQAEPPDADAFPATHRTGLAFAKPGGGLEAAITGSSYRLGPGDSLAVNIWGSESISYRLAVTLEGKLIIPTVGELRVDGLLLDEARSRIREHLQEYFRNVDVTVSLLRLRRFQVHVLGQVNNPGTYIATAADRVSSAVGWAGGFTTSASQRRVSIQIGDSVRAHADLFAFLARGDTKYNPWLRDGDVVYVPFAQDRFYVRGAVNQPGAFEHVPGDRFSDALFYAGGFTTDAFLDSIEVARFQGLAEEPLRFFSIRGDGLAPARLEETRPVPGVTTTFVPRVGA
jgi:protein involved in polysaccharide export with SLBB domain